MRLLIIIVLCILGSGVIAAEPAEKATAIRDTALYAAPYHASAEVAQVTAGTTLVVYERERLWVRAAPSDAAEDDAGWLRFTELRFDTTAASPAKSATAQQRGGFAGFSRSVSGFLQGFRGRGQKAPQATSTIGIRGLTVAELEAAAPDPNALALVDRYTISKADAEQFAGVGGLTARDVAATGGQQ